MNFFVFFSSLSLSLVLGANVILATVYYPWMYYLPYGNTVTLKPLFKNRSEVINIESCRWITPKQVELIPDVYNFDIYRYRLFKSTCELTIFNIQKDTNGIYHCIVNEMYVSKAMLNVHGAPKESIYEEFKPNLIAGLITAASKY